LTQTPLQILRLGERYATQDRQHQTAAQQTEWRQISKTLRDAGFEPATYRRGDRSINPLVANVCPLVISSF